MILMPELAKEMAVFNRKAVGLARAARQRREAVPAARYLTRLAVTRGSDPREYWVQVAEALKEGVPGERAAASAASALEECAKDANATVRGHAAVALGRVRGAR
jgi:hypothetical protein